MSLRSYFLYGGHVACMTESKTWITFLVAHTQKLEALSTILAKLEGLPCADHKLKIESQTDKHTNIETSISRIDTSISFMQKEY